jgi:hypothetical protein
MGFLPPSRRLVCLSATENDRVKPDGKEEKQAANSPIMSRGQMIEYVRGQKELTKGAFFFGESEHVFLRSGRAGPAKDIPLGTSGFDAYTRTHVEGHAAALMRQQGIQNAVVYINNSTICRNCDRNLSLMLPSAAKLKVVLPNGIIKEFTGTH